MATRISEHFYLLGAQPRDWSRFRHPAAKLRKRSEIHEAILQAPKQSSVWIATKSVSTDALLREAFSGRIRSRLGRLLMLFPPRPGSLPALEELFAPVAWGTESFKLLPYEELAEVLVADNRHDLFVGGFVDPKSVTLILYRGDFERVAVPLSAFNKPGSGPTPNPAALSISDYGQTT